MRRLEFPLRSLSQAAAAAMPVVGTAVPVIIASPKELPAPGAWIKLRNCLFYVLEGQVQGRMLEKSRWRPRQEDKALVKEYARRVKQGIMSACAPPQEQWFTCTSHGDQPVSPLRKLAVEEMTQPGVPMSYRCVVRVLATQPPPSDVATASIPGTLVHDSTNAAGSAAPVEWLYALQLRVEDGSGSLFVDVYGEDGALFFSEIAPPQDLRASPQARDAVGTALGQLMGEGCSEPQGCWMEVCVLRYWPNSQGGAPRYRVFDTKVLASRMQS